MMAPDDLVRPSLTASCPASILPRPAAYVLGGGASSAAAQVGMLRALAESGISPDIIIGTSAGALNGVILADDPVGAVTRLEAIWTTLKTRRLIPDTRLRRARNLAGRRHMYMNHGLCGLFEEHITSTTFEELAMVFACVATDLDDGSAVILDSGHLLSALLATCAIPGVFPTVMRDGRALVDGLCVANLPVREALELGAASVVVLDGRPGSQPPGPRKDVRDTIGAAFAATLAQQRRSDLEYVAGHVPVWTLPGQPSSGFKAFEFSQSEALIEDAYCSTLAYLGRMSASVGVN